MADFLLAGLEEIGRRSGKIGGFLTALAKILATDDTAAGSVSNE
jgi:hypothetical protein